MNIRQLAHDSIPDPIRKPLGKVTGWFYNHVVRWVEGALFDLSGGRFYTSGCVFEIPKDQTSRDYRACFFDGSYEAEERELVRKFVRPEDSVLELGACLGVVSCVTNKLLADKTRHVVVEGNPLCIPTLERSRDLNDSGFRIENCAVSTRQDAAFYLHPRYIVGGTTQRESSRPVKVPVCSLAEINAKYGPFTTLIMDIEGSELEVLSAASNELRHCRLIIVELHDWAISDEGVNRCRELMKVAGLTFEERSGLTEVWQRRAQR